jgi:NAD(P) transhydrogenase subunit alpha
MIIGIPKCTTATERRVPIVPESVKRLAAKKIDTVIEVGAGLRACIADDEYTAVGAKVEASLGEGAGAADTIVRLRAPTLDEARGLKEGIALVAPLYPLLNPELVKVLAARKITAIALDLIPRTTIAQTMDILSSQASIAGYYAVIDAATKLPRFFPMLMTAAGTIAPARILILGAGVAGLSAIGTARRLGGVVEAFDVRAVVKEQVESLGAKFVVVEGAEDAAGAGGYAKEQSADAQAKQAAAIAKHVKSADVVICTALIPGRKAPVLVTEEMVKSMKLGSVVYDLAAEQEGNCALTVPGEIVVRHGVTIVGALDVPSHLAVHASQMYSRNVEKLLLHLTKDGAWKLDPKDEIVAGCLVTKDGEIVHAKVKERMQ